jgi:hypothetical protein
VNELGTAAPRGRPLIDPEQLAAELSELAGKPVELPAGAVGHTGPATCPACGSEEIMWGCDSEQTRGKDEIHPTVWDEIAWMADSFICRLCWAGWVEPNDPEPISWVRPYWVVER